MSKAWEFSKSGMAIGFMAGAVAGAGGGVFGIISTGFLGILVGAVVGAGIGLFFDDDRRADIEPRSRERSPAEPERGPEPAIQQEVAPARVEIHQTQSYNFRDQEMARRAAAANQTRVIT